MTNINDTERDHYLFNKQSFFHLFAVRVTK